MSTKFWSKKSNRIGTILIVSYNLIYFSINKDFKIFIFLLKK